MKKLITALLLGTALGAQAMPNAHGHKLGEPMVFCPDGYRARTTLNSKFINCIKEYKLPTGSGITIFFALKIQYGKVTELSWATDHAKDFAYMLTDVASSLGKGEPQENGILWKTKEFRVEATMQDDFYFISIFE